MQQRAVFREFAIAMLCLVSLALSRASVYAQAERDAKMSAIQRITQARFAEADTLLLRAKRAQSVDKSVALRYERIFQEVLAENQPEGILRALQHIRKHARGYAQPTALTAPIRLALSNQKALSFPVSDAADLLNALADLDLSASDHRAVRDRLTLIKQLPQGKISPAVRASAIYKLGYIEFFADNLSASAEAFEEAGRLYGEAGKTSRRIRALDASSSAYGENGQLAKSVACAKRAIALVEAQEDVHATQLEHVNLYLNYAEVLYRVGEHREAFENVKFAQSLAAESDDASMVARALKTDGLLHLWSENYAQATRLLTEAQKRFEAINDVYLIASTLKELAGSYEGAGEHELALRVFRRHTELRDSLTQSQQRDTVDKLVESHQAESNQRELALLREQTARLAAQNESHRYQRWAFGLLLIGVTGLCAYVWHRLRVRRRHHDELERKVADRTAELSEYARRLERSNADLERFAYIASHDLKTPLRNVTSFLNLIERRLTPEAKNQVADYLNIAVENARQMHHLVTDVLEFSKINANLATECTNFDVGDRVRDMVASMQPQLKEQSAAVVVKGHAELHAPMQYIVQLVRNLIENGIKYNESKAPLIMVDIATDAQAICIRVTDNGIGIAPQYHSQVFELFKRLHTSDVYSGTGLGLAVCKKVVERLGGEITLESTVGEGSTFSVSLPQNCADDLTPMPRSKRTNAYELAKEVAN